jgi:hypothetical protein
LSKLAFLAREQKSWFLEIPCRQCRLKTVFLPSAPLLSIALQQQMGVQGNHSPERPLTSSLLPTATEPVMRQLFPAALTRFLSLCVVATFCLSCAPRQEGVSENSFFAGGLANFSLSVAPPLGITSSGRLSANVPSDSIIAPMARLAFALFGEPGDGPVVRHVHTLFSELPTGSWQWEKETWALPQTIAYSKITTGGNFWTTQILPVISAGDWFSALWAENGRTAPEFWLAKRWSATPEREMRVVAEYREPAPACMRQRLNDSLLADDRNSIPLRGKNLRSGCEDEIDAFSVRADAAVRLESMGPAPSGAQSVRALQSRLPAGRPDMAKLVGKAEKIDVGGDRFPSD